MLGVGTLGPFPHSFTAVVTPVAFEYAHLYVHSLTLSFYYPAYRVLPLISFSHLTVCPSCSNTLILATNPETDQNRYECRTCPFEFHISKTISGRVWMKRKEVEDVMGGKEAWANVDKTEGKLNRSSRTWSTWEEGDPPCEWT